MVTQTGWGCALPQVGGLPFWVFSVAMIWRRGDTGDLPGFVRIWTKTGLFCGPKANMKHLKHPKHLKHLKHLKWMLELLFCKHFKELVGKVKDGVDGRQYQKRMLLFSGWIDAIDAIEDYRGL